MTEAGEKWVDDKFLSCRTPSNSLTLGQTRTFADFWISAFCAEVGRRAVVKIHDCGFDTDTARWKAFTELKKELLG